MHPKLLRLFSNFRLTSVLFSATSDFWPFYCDDQPWLPGAGDKVAIYLNSSKTFYEFLYLSNWVRRKKGRLCLFNYLICFLWTSTFLDDRHVAQKQFMDHKPIRLQAYEWKGIANANICRLTIGRT